MSIFVTAEYYNRLKMAGHVSKDEMFTGFKGLLVPIKPKNKHQMPYGAEMVMVEER